MAKVPAIVPVSDLRQDAARVLKNVKDLKQPLFITQRGRATAVLMSLDAYERSEAERDLLLLLARGEKEIAAGVGHPSSRYWPNPTSSCRKVERGRFLHALGGGQFLSAVETIRRNNRARPEGSGSRRRSAQAAFSSPRLGHGRDGVSGTSLPRGLHQALPLLLSRSRRQGLDRRASGMEPRCPTSQRTRRQFGCARPSTTRRPLRGVRGSLTGRRIISWTPPSPSPPAP